MSSYQQTPGTVVAAPPGAETFVDVLRYRARTQPDSVACARIHEEGHETSWTYAQLDRRARAVAAFLQQRVALGDRVVLMFPNELDFIAAFFGCLYAGAIAVPVYPPMGDRVDRALKKLAAILRSAQPVLGLTLPEWAQHGDGPSADGQVPWFAVSEISDAEAEGWQCPTVTPEMLAFLQFTSGSTGDPKGVMVSHSNLIANQAVMSQWWAFEADSKFVTWLPLHHDMGLIGCLLNSIHSAVPLLLLDPTEFLRNPYRWMEVVSRHRGTHIGAPNFAYDLCARKITADQRNGLDLSSLVMASNGAEPVRMETLDRFAQLFAPSGFNSRAFCTNYGLAEATLCVSGGPRGRGTKSVGWVDGALDPRVGNPKSLMSCGPTAPNHCVIAVDPKTHTVVPDRSVGEIWIHGPSVCQGYWGLEELSTQTFRAQLPGDERRWLRTGDLGFIGDGELYVTGRLKDMLILRGRNHHPQDIERTLEDAASTLVRPGCSAAFAIEVDGEERLAVVAEIEPRQFLNPDQARELVQRLRAAVASEHGVGLHLFVLVAARTIPKTSSGKLQRRRCREDLLHGALQEVGRWELATRADDAGSPDPEAGADSRPVFDYASVSAGLIRILAQLTHQRQSQIDLNAPLSAFGVDSLKAVEILADLEVWSGRKIDEDAVNVDMPLREIVDIIIELPGAAQIDPARLQALLIAAVQSAPDPASRIDLDAPISTYGIDRVKASDLASEIEASLNCPLPADSIDPAMSIRAIVDRITSR